MAYKIQYAAISPEKYVPVKRSAIMKHWKTVVVVIILIACVLFVKELLFSGERYMAAEVSDVAVDKMVQAIKNGDSVYDAVTAFCLEVIENGRQD